MTIFAGGNDPMAGTFANRSGFSKALVGFLDPERMDAMQKQDAVKDVFAGINSGAIPRGEALARYAELSGDPQALINGMGNTPAALQEWAAFQQMTPEQQQRYLTMKRSSQMFDRGGSQVILNPDGTVKTEIDKTLPPEQTPQTKYEQAKSTEAGKADATKEQGLPGAQAKADYIVEKIDDVLNDPNLDSALGGFLGIRGRQSATAPLSAEQRGVQPKLDQLKGQAFLQAFESLKGAGAITEAEGTAATQAIARLSQAQEPKDYREALNDLRNVVTAARNRMVMNVKSPTGSAPAAPAAGGDAPAAPVVLTPPAGGNGAPKTINFGDLK